MLRSLASAFTLGMIVLGATASDTAAQGYPARPIRLIIPFGAAGSADILARIFTQRMALGQPIVVENVPGAAGAIGMTRAAKSAPDGYTLSTGAVSTFAINPHISTNLSYDPIKDFVPIAMLATISSVLVVNSKILVKSVSELVALAKANPGKLNYASLGTGSFHHLVSEMFRRSVDINIVHVPYKGAAQALTALLAGEVQMFFFPAFVDAMPHLKSDRLRALGVIDSNRSPVAPDIPTLSELGYQIVAPSWHIVAAPAGTPNPIVQRLSAEIQRVSSLEEVKQILEKQGAEPQSTTPGALREYVTAEYARYGRVIREIGIKTD